MEKMFDNICASLEKGDQSKMRIYLYILLAVISTGMTILNIVQDKGILTWFTGVFAVLSVADLIMTTRKGIWVDIATYLFIGQILAMFTGFLITGNPDGFSAIWICMLPPASLFLYKRKQGTVVCIVMWAILIFLLWTPIGRGLLMYDYGATFCTRFPILYIAFYAIAFFLSSVTEGSLARTIEARKRYKHLSTHDMLTGLYNRQGMYSVSKRLGETYDNLGVAMVDIDYFKKVNDTYGHKAGDAVLKGLSDYMTQNLDAVLSRWGGEEFVAIYQRDKVSRIDIERLRIGISQQNFLAEDFPDAPPVTVSIGVCEPTRQEHARIDLVIDKADAALYDAKKRGRNQVIYCD